MERNITNVILDLKSKMKSGGVTKKDLQESLKISGEDGKIKFFDGIIAISPDDKELKDLIKGFKDTSDSIHIKTALENAIFEYLLNKKKGSIGKLINYFEKSEKETETNEAKSELDKEFDKILSYSQKEAYMYFLKNIKDLKINFVLSNLINDFDNEIYTRLFEAYKKNTFLAEIKEIRKEYLSGGEDYSQNQVREKSKNINSNNEEYWSNFKENMSNKYSHLSVNKSTNDNINIDGDSYKAENKNGHIIIGENSYEAKNKNGHINIGENSYEAENKNGHITIGKNSYKTKNKNGHINIGGNSYKAENENGNTKVGRNLGEIKTKNGKIQIKDENLSITIDSQYVSQGNRESNIVNIKGNNNFFMQGNNGSNIANIRGNSNITIQGSNLNNINTGKKSNGPGKVKIIYKGNEHKFSFTEGFKEEFGSQTISFDNGYLKVSYNG